jgi:hypothetical protein
MRTSRTAVLAAAAGTLVLGLVSVAGPAGATVVASADTVAPVLRAVNVTPEPVVLRQDRVSTITFKVRATDDVGVTAVEAIVVSARNDDDGGPLKLHRVSGTAQDGIWAGSVVVDSGLTTGRWAATAVVVDKAGNESALDESTRFDEFLVRHHAKFADVKATPRSARKGSKVRLTGTLTRLNAKDKYVPYAGQRVSVQFRAKGTSAWVRVSSVKTGAKGTFSRSVAVSKPGTFRVVVAATNRVTGATSKGKAVTLR